MTWSAPARAARWPFSGLLTVVMTVASDHRASWIAALPTAPAPPATRTVRPSSVPGPSRRRPVLGHGQAPVRGQERHPEAGAEVERRDVGQQHHVPGRHDGVLLRGAAGGTQVGRLPDPDPQAQQRRLDALPDGVDHPGAVLVRHLRRVDGDAGLAAASRLPVGRVDARSGGSAPAPRPVPARAPAARPGVRTSGSPVTEYSIARTAPTVSPPRCGRHPSAAVRRNADEDAPPEGSPSRDRRSERVPA